MKYHPSMIHTRKVPLWQDIAWIAGAVEGAKGVHLGRCVVTERGLRSMTPEENQIAEVEDQIRREQART